MFSKQAKSNQKVPTPFFEVGPIKTSDYDVKIEEMLKANNLQIPHFKAEGQLYANLQLKPNAPRTIGKIVKFDSRYVSKMTDKDPDFEKWNEFGVMMACFHQLFSTFDSSTKYECKIIEEELQTKLDLPKIYCDVVRLLGDKPSPYGAIRHKHPVQAVIDFLMHGVATVLGPKPEGEFDTWTGPRREFLLRHPSQVKFLSKFDELIVKGSDHHYILTDAHQSTYFSKSLARVLFDEFANSTAVIQRNTNGSTFDVQLWPADRWESLINIAENESTRKKNFDEFSKWINNLNLSQFLKNRLIGLMSIIIWGFPTTTDQANACVEFVCVAGITLKDLAKLCRLLFQVYQSIVPPVLKKIYSTETFKSSGVGHSMQVIVVDELSDEGRFHSKVQAKGYPIAVAMMFPVTRSVEIVRKSYSAYTELDDDSAVIFPVSDSLVGRGKS